MAAKQDKEVIANESSERQDEVDDVGATDDNLKSKKVSKDQ